MATTWSVQINPYGYYTVESEDGSSNGKIYETFSLAKEDCDDLNLTILIHKCISANNPTA